MMLAQQAATTQAVADGRLTLGVGLSHPVVVEALWGLSYDRPYRYMREYLSILVPLLEGETVTVEGEVLTARAFAPVTRPEVPPVPVIVAALGPAMLRLAGRVAAGTVTWTTGPKTLAEHVVPTITGAAAEAGRPAPRVVVGLPITVTDDPDAAYRRIDTVFAGYPDLPSYRAMLDHEGADFMSQISLVGSETEVRAGLERLEAAGATDYIAPIVGDADDRRRTLALLAEVVS
jgi:F420-dependent oxidoreductase-like protein